MLTHIQIASAKPSAKPFNLSDSQGLFLTVQPNVSKLWRLSYRYLGRQKTLHLGPWPDVSLTDAFDQDRRTSDAPTWCLDQRGRWSPLVEWHRLEGMPGLFGAASHLAHRRTLVRRQSRNLRGNLRLRRCAIACPARTWPPATTPRHRTGARIVTDRRGQDRRCAGARLTRLGWPLQPAQSLDRQLRQEERGDPCHRKPRA